MQCRVPFCTFVCHDGSQPNVPNVNTLFSCFSFVVVYVCVRSSRLLISISAHLLFDFELLLF